MLPVSNLLYLEVVEITDWDKKLLRVIKMACKISKQKFGETVDGVEVSLYFLSANKIEVGVTNYGANIVYLKVPDKKGNVDDIVTGFDALLGKLWLPVWSDGVPVR